MGDNQSTHFDRRALLMGGAAAALGACAREADLRRGESGRIANVSDGDLLALDTGQRVRLAEIEAPSPYGEGAPYGEEARDLLQREAIGRTATLYYGGVSRDRYDRALAHVFVTDEVGRSTWLNGLMISQGAARVRTYADNAARAAQLYALEDTARGNAQGLWALEAYRLRSPSDWPAPSEPRAFIIAEGRLAAIDPAERYGVIRRDGDGLRLAPPASLDAAFAPAGLLAGAAVRMRGRTRITDDAVTIDFSHWQQVEILA